MPSPDSHDRRPEAPSSAAPEGAFEGPSEFAQTVRRALDHALREGVRRIEWCDADFLAWPLGEAAFVEALTRWARGGARELRMVAADFEPLRLAAPRFAQWRQDYAHVISCLTPEERLRDDVPTLWIDGSGLVLQVFDRVHWRGRLGVDRPDRQRAREGFDAIAQRATPAFSSTTLGL